jgi:nitroreductase
MVNLTQDKASDEFEKGSKGIHRRRSKGMIKDLVLQNRSYRRFAQAARVERETLRELVELARLSPSAMNVQPLKFYLSNEPEQNEKIFKCLAWAGYLKDWPGPQEGERPAAYIIILGDTRLRGEFGVDPGIVAQSMLLGAVERGLGGCIVGSVKRTELGQELALAEHFQILYVIALGVPVEQVVVEPVGADGDIQYWRDERGVHHVPKRALDELIVG